MSRSKKIGSDILIGLLTSHKYRIYRHLFLLLFIGTTLLSMGPIATYSSIIFSVFLLFLFYTNMYFLVPWFLLKKRYAEYSIGILVYVAIAFFVVIWMRRLAPSLPALPEAERPDFKIFPFIFLALIFAAASSAVKLFQRLIADSRRINELERITMQSELEQLKSQINPHFLFNMLNTANVLIQRDPIKASQVLIKLSDLLRYQLYDIARSKVLLTADIHFLEDFLELEKIRRDNFKCNVYKHGELEGVMVSPLLFIVFAENAIKHNVDTERPSFVDLYFGIYKDELHFGCINSKPPMALLRNNTGGLGLANVKRRLDLIYPSRHKLHIENSTEIYSVTLTIQL